MSSPDFREPTNDELWEQPNRIVPPIPQTGAVAPVPPAPLPAPVPLAQPPVPAAKQQADRTVFVLALVSIALGIPLTAIGSGTAGLPGLLVVWLGIVAVNFIYARSRRD